MTQKKPVNTFRIVRFFLFLVLIYLVFTQYGMDSSDIPQEFSIDQSIEIGENKGKGNLVGIQPWMEPIDYASDSNFYKKLNFYFAEADDKGWFNDSSIVVLPEYLGTWLIAINERNSVYTNTTTAQAIRTVVVRNIIKFIPAYFSSTAEDPVREALFAMKSQTMADAYTNTISKLARKYGVAVVGGSIILQNPMVQHGTIISQEGPLYNVSALFRPDGSVQDPLTFKAFPIEEEQAFCAAKPVSEIPVYPTAAGRLAVMICADSWYPEAYEQIHRDNPKLLAIPSYSAGDSLWQTTWQGYNGAHNPQDIDTDDIGHITEEMAWLKYSLGGRAQTADVAVGINVFLRGQLWDLGTDGKTISYRNGALKVNPPTDGATITNLWLN